SDHSSRPVQGHPARSRQGAHSHHGHPERDHQNRSDLRHQAGRSQSLHGPQPTGHHQQMGGCEAAGSPQRPDAAGGGCQATGQREAEALVRRSGQHHRTLDSDKDG
ncbi:hypothetical protein M9458_016827, partial [Cirrhinus mrigala]